MDRERRTDKNRGTDEDIGQGKYEYMYAVTTKEEINNRISDSIHSDVHPTVSNVHVHETSDKSYEYMSGHDSTSGLQQNMGKDPEINVNTTDSSVNETVTNQSTGNDKTELMPRKHSEFSVRSRDDDRSVWIEGVLTMSDRVIVVDAGNYKIKLFDAKGALLSSKPCPNIVFDITHVDGDTFATCGPDFKVRTWRVVEDTIVSEPSSYSLDHEAQALHFNGTYFCVLHRREKTVSILSSKGNPFTKLTMNKLFGQKLEFGASIFMESDSHNICVPAWGDFRGVLCLSVHGSPLWYSPIPGSPEGITMIGGSYCIADEKNQCLHVISTTGQSADVLIRKDDLSGIPHRVLCDQKRNKLYISYQNYDQKSCHVISIFSM